MGVEGLRLGVLRIWGEGEGKVKASGFRFMVWVSLRPIAPTRERCHGN